MYVYIVPAFAEDRATLASDPSAAMVPYGTGGFLLGRPPAFDSLPAGGLKLVLERSEGAKNAFCHHRRIVQSPTN